MVPKRQAPDPVVKSRVHQDAPLIGVLPADAKVRHHNGATNFTERGIKKTPPEQGQPLGRLASDARTKTNRSKQPCNAVLTRYGLKDVHAS
jgi:hypothetical protein